MDGNMMSEFSDFAERDVDGVKILTLDKGLRGETENRLRTRLEQLVRSGHTNILVDLEQMPYMDSTELGRLIRSHLAVRQAGGRVRLCNLSEKVLTLMKLTHLDTVLDLYKTEKEALASILKAQESSE
jgi:anti-anti-sigma factor